MSDLPDEASFLKKYNEELIIERDKLRAENEALREQLEASEAILEDEEAGAAETFDLWKLREAEAARLRSALEAIRVTAREQTVKPGAPVEHALDFVVALDRILSLAEDATKEAG